MQTKSKSIGGHQSANMRTDEWLTPPEIIKALGTFDLDPCSPINRPWDTATVHYTILDNGLKKVWNGRVWMNPPYGSECEKWMNKLAFHGNGISLIFARTETQMFFNHVWNKADSIFFFEGRIFFYTVAGKAANMNSGAPSCLISYGEDNSQAIEDSGLKGKHVPLNSPPIVIVGISPTWKSLVSIVIKRLSGEATVRAITELVETIAPDKIQANNHYREQIRKILQQHFKRQERGVYASNELFN